MCVLKGKHLTFLNIYRNSYSKPLPHGQTLEYKVLKMGLFTSCCCLRLYFPIFIHCIIAGRKNATKKIPPKPCMTKYAISLDHTSLRFLKNLRYSSPTPTSYLAFIVTLIKILCMAFYNTFCLYCDGTEMRPFIVASSY